MAFTEETKRGLDRNRWWHPAITVLWVTVKLVNGIKNDNILAAAVAAAADDDDDSNIFIQSKQLFFISTSYVVNINISIMEANSKKHWFEVS